ncbi:MAG TPA: methyltransferase [Candidatus Cloacimonetes bacterium]|nr:methyltransferase [Candidatus Cloacimonadota bacterium]
MSLKPEKQYGDYQTPTYFSKKIAQFIKNDLGYVPDTVIEPTCGTGSFIRATNETYDNVRIIGNEINETYVSQAKSIEPRKKNEIEIQNYDYFRLKKAIEVNKTDQLLIIGNPPWVTNSSISAESGDNLPKKSNFKNLSGYDALTGSSNFDISESMIVDLVHKYYMLNPLISMICKTTVAINVFKYMHETNIGMDYFKIERIDALEVFNVSVDACVIYVKLHGDKNTNAIEWLDEENKGRKSGFIGTSFYMNLSESANQIEGETEIEWRQGIKHDAGKIMELKKVDNLTYINGLKEKLTLESERVFPLVKSSHLKEHIITDFKKYVIVTQDMLKQDTNYIEQTSPLLWNYLNDKIDHFAKRKSSIYENSPKFSMFGIGDYTWLPYKVGVSGFYKKPTFSLLINEKPVMLDDTSYFLGFQEYDIAYTIMLVLNSHEVQSFLKQIANLKSKRPYTKKVLSRISIEKSFKKIPYNEMKQIEKRLGLENYLTENHYEVAKQKFTQQQLFLDL